MEIFNKQSLTLDKSKFSYNCLLAGIVVLGLLVVLNNVLVMIFYFLYVYYEKISLKNFSYELLEDRVVIVKGVIIKKKIVFPYKIVQDVIVENGIVLNKFGLSNIELDGVDKTIHLNGIKKERAEQIKKLILEKKEQQKIIL